MLDKTLDNIDHDARLRRLQHNADQVRSVVHDQRSNTLAEHVRRYESVHSS